MTKKIHLSSITFLQLYSFLTIALYGLSFFKRCTEYNFPSYYLPIAFVLVWQLSFIIFSIFLSNKYIKTISSTLLILNSLVFYSMYSYNAQFDKIMFMNLLQTDSGEIAELLNYKILLFLTLLGILPCIGIFFCKIEISPIIKNIKSMLISVISILIIGGICYHNTNIFFHRYKYLQDYLPPINYIQSIAQVTINKLTPRPELQKISEDITAVPNKEKPDLIVFIVGETTRAANFSLNGYHRPTNEPLNEYLNEIIYYPDTLACGTSTAIAVPCMFSLHSQKDYKEGSELYIENVLDIFTKADYKVKWLDNDGGCKDVCNRVYYEEPCESKTCIDDILLENLKEKIENNHNNQLVVLHTRGSHGPSYHLRYTDGFDIYSPICTSNELWNCSEEELINVYDNTIHYVSNFIAQTIKILKSLEDKYNPILIYTSDHGESLEDGIYLHAAPYDTAPMNQKLVPMLVWMPKHNDNINIECVRKKAQNNKHSHDNIFHSLLGISGIKSQHYLSELDIFYSCKK